MQQFHQEGALSLDKLIEKRTLLVEERDREHSTKLFVWRKREIMA